ncbi:MAG: hypothetical protein IJ163_03055 [Bacteroidaceae bacterium]|nr:hypothetical protein [Bacteroidaceae bacterium]
MKRHFLNFVTAMFFFMAQSLCVSAQTDYTNKITNPSFEDGTMNGWTTYIGGEINTEVAGSKPEANFPLTNADGTYICDYYGWAWSWDPFNGLKQTIPSLPKGAYTLTAILGGWKDWELTLDVDGNKQSQTMTADNTGTLFSVDFTLNESKDVVIAASTAHVNHNTWEPCFMKADNFRLTYYDYISFFAEPLPNTATDKLIRDKWYYYDAPALASYSLDGDFQNIVYTSNGKQCVSGTVNAKNAQQNITLNAGRVYFKSNADGSTLHIACNLTEGSTKNFTVCALNVDGLPQRILTLNLNEDGPGEEGTKLISQYLASKGYDILGFSEDFNYDGSLRRYMTDYSYGTIRSTLSLTSLSIPFDTDGLNLYWKSSQGISAFDESWTRWTDSKSGEGNQFIKKGFRYYTVELEEGILIDVYVLHMDAGGTEYADTRNAQWSQLSDAVLANPYPSRPKIIIGDTNSRWTREDIMGKFYNPVSTKYTVNDAWVELCLNGNYNEATVDPSGYGWGYVDQSNPLDYSKYEVVDKIIYLNPKGSNTLQLKATSFTLNQDYTYGTVNGSGDTKPLGDHKPLVVTFTATQPSQSYEEVKDRWTWKGEEISYGNSQWYLYNIHYGMYDAGRQGFLTSTGSLTLDPNYAAKPFGIWGGNGTGTISNDDGNRLRLYYSNLDYKAEIASSSATTFTIVESSNYAGNADTAYHFTASDHYFQAESPTSLDAASNPSMKNAWALVSTNQKAMYDRYVKAWEKGCEYVSHLPMSSKQKEKMSTLLAKNTYWTEGTTEALEALNQEIESWFDDDKTGYITNPSFELDENGVQLTTEDTYTNHVVPGWRVSADAWEAFSSYRHASISDAAPRGRDFDGAEGNYVFNTWGGSPSSGFFCEQTISNLPEGFYKLEANFTSNEGSVVRLAIGSKSQSSAVAGRPQSTTIEVPLYYHDGESDLIIGAYSSEWFEADAFNLFRYDYYYDEQITNAKYATTAIRYNTDIPAGFNILYASAINPPSNDKTPGGDIRNSIQLEEYNGNQLKAEEGVILYADINASRTFRFYRTSDEVESISGNLLVGTSKRIEAADKQAGKNYYMLSKKDIVTDASSGTTENVVGFFKLASGTAIKANKAYLSVDADNELAAKSFYRFSFDNTSENAPTPVESIDSSAEAKVIGIFSIDGYRRSGLQKGINILRFSDGKTKKIMVK